MIKDSGNRTPMGDTGFVRDMHDGKGRMDLLPWRAIIEVSKHCEEGAKKYGERNIDKGCPQHSLIDAAFRHLAKYTIGMTDEDHLRACAWNILWALEQEVSRPDMQDIPARMESPRPVCDIEKELEELSSKYPSPGYHSGIRRGIRECWEKIKESMILYESNVKDRRCAELTCFYNTLGVCYSTSDTWNPDFGEKCPDYSED